MKKFTLLLVFLTYLSVLAFSQREIRPKLAVVLSGGGAKGVAHIPLLQVLDSLGVKPDIIVGTSMGSVVGGLYAMGYSADTIAHIALTMDWDRLLTNKIPYNYVLPSERDEVGKYSIKIPFKDFKPELPSGLIESQELSLLFSRLSTAVAEYEDFDDFPIAYRAVSTDIVNGKQINLGEGDVALAIRSSMAIPTFFTPVELNETILVDGGVLDNFPVDVAIDLGAEVIIGSDVSGGFIPREKINSLVEVMMQSAVISSALRNEDARKNCDVLFDHVPNLTYTTADFNKAQEIYEQGTIAVNEKLDELVHTLEPYFGTRKEDFARPVSNISYNEFRLEGISGTEKELITQRVGLEFKGKRISIDDLEEELRYGKGSQLYKNLNYRYFVENGKRILQVRGKKTIKSYVQGAVHYDSERGAGIILNGTVRDFFGKRSRSLVSVDAAENPKIRIQHQQYLPNTWYWWKFDYFYENVIQEEYQSGFEQDDFNFNFQNFRFGLNRDLSPNSTVSLNILYDQDAISPDISIETRNIPRDSLVFIIQKLRMSSFGGELALNVNTLNTRFFPNKGTSLTAGIQLRTQNNLKINWYSDALEDLFESTNTSMDPEIGAILNANINYEKNFSISEKLTLRSKAIIHHLFPKEDSLFINFGTLRRSYLGGIEKRANPQYLQFPGLRDGELAVSQLLGLRIALQWEPVDNLFVTPSFNTAAVGFGTFRDYWSGVSKFETNWSDDQSSSKWIYSGALKLSYMSPLGPVNFLVAKPNDIPSFRFYFGIGFHFE